MGDVLMNIALNLVANAIWAVGAFLAASGCEAIKKMPIRQNGNIYAVMALSLS